MGGSVKGYEADIQPLKESPAAPSFPTLHIMFTPLRRRHLRQGGQHRDDRGCGPRAPRALLLRHRTHAAARGQGGAAGHLGTR